MARYLIEVPTLRWLDRYPKCRCGKPSAGILRDVRNVSYGDHCERCAEKRLRDSKKVAEMLLRDGTQESGLSGRHTAQPVSCR